MKPHSSENASANRIPQRLQILIIQRHQPHLRIELESVLKPSLRNLQLAQNRIIAREVVVDDGEVGMLLNRCLGNHIRNAVIPTTTPVAPVSIPTIQKI